jgi:hypothetical protein
LQLALGALHARDAYYTDEVDELSVIQLVERLSKAVGWHLNAGDMMKGDSAKLVLLLCVLKVGINVLCTLVMAVFSNYGERWLVVCIE